MANGSAEPGSTAIPGAGGDGVHLNGAGANLLNTGAIEGGDGGQGQGGGSSVASGDGGHGVVLAQGTTLTNHGTITGGAGAASNGGLASTAGAQGAAVIGAGVTVINAGSLISAGDAVRFTGGINRLGIQAGSSITGTVAANGTVDTLALGGSADANFDVSAIGASAQYRGFEVFEKTDTAVWN